MTGETEPTAAQSSGAPHLATQGATLKIFEEKTPSGLAWWAWTAPAFIAFSVAAWVQSRAPQIEFFLALNHGSAALPPMLWSILTTLGDASVLFCLLSPLLVWRPQMMLAILAAVPLGGLLSVSLKALYQAHRPATVIDVDQFNVVGPLLNNASFPSGHTITAFAAALALVAMLVMQARQHAADLGGLTDADSRLRIAATSSPMGALITVMALFAVLSVAALIGFSRVAVGAHWPVDVLAGAACGWLAGLSGAWVALRYPKVWQARISQFVVGQLLLLTALWLLLNKPEYALGAPAVWLAVACVLVTVVWQFGAMYRRLNRRS